MLIKKVNRRYAKALLDFAKETGNVEEIYKDVLLLRQYLQECADLKVVLKSPIIMPKHKEGVIDKVFNGKVNDIVMNFLKIVIRRGREGNLDETLYSFINQYRVFKGIEEAVITTATPLTEAQRTLIHDRISKLTHHEIEMVEKVDQSVIGGLRIKLGDREYNATISKQLEKLRRSFEENIFVPEF